MELSRFGIVGDPIKIAARFETLTRMHKVGLLIGETAFADLDDPYLIKEIPQLVVKGRAEPIRTFYIEGILEGHRDSSQSAQDRESGQ